MPAVEFPGDFRKGVRLPYGKATARADPDMGFLNLQMLEAARGEEQGLGNSGPALFTLPLSIHALPLKQDTGLDGPVV